MSISVRLEAHRAAKEGRTTAAQALAGLLGAKGKTAEPDRPAAMVRTAAASPAPAPSAWEQRAKAVAQAVSTDPALKGRAAAAMQILANKDLSGLSTDATIAAAKMAQASDDAETEARCAAIMGLVAKGATVSAAVAAADAIKPAPSAPAKAAEKPAPAAPAPAPKPAAQVDYAAGWKKAAAAVNAIRGR